MTALACSGTVTLTMWARRIEKALSFRVILTSLMLAAIVAAAGLAVWEPLAYLGYVAGAAAYIGQVLDPGTVARCPTCRKRVKLAARACHHCGRSVA